MVSTLPANFDLEQYIQSLYQDVLGREPDNGGRAWWVNDPQVQGWLESGGVPKLRSAFISGIQGDADAKFNNIKSNLVPYANNLTQDTANEWNAYMNRAAAEQQGMNKMPGVFNGYLGLYNAQTPEAANALVYNTADQQKATLEAASKYWQTAGGFGGLGASGSKTTTPATDEAAGPRKITTSNGDYVMGARGKYVPA